jgi:hypothetical protein
LPSTAIVGPLALIPGAIVCAVVVGIEVLVATEALGPLYERIDVLSVERTGVNRRSNAEPTFHKPFPRFQLSNVDKAAEYIRECARIQF